MDLDSENQMRDGVVIDIRNNNGGFVNAYALDVLARRPYLNMTPRGLSCRRSGAEHARPAGARAARPSSSSTSTRSPTRRTSPKATARSSSGKVVGEPTAGWIIYTSGTRLIDGSILRLPMVRITTASGENMERHPRPVDIRVDAPLGEWYAGSDSQLDAAVSELLREVGHAPIPSGGQ